jgi:hypothetical protein
MHGRHGTAVAEGDVVELLRQAGGDARVEAHEFVRAVLAWVSGRPACTRRRELDAALSPRHWPLQPVALPSDGWWPSMTEAGQFSGATERLPGRVANPHTEVRG